MLKIYCKVKNKIFLMLLSLLIGTSALTACTPQNSNTAAAASGSQGLVQTGTSASSVQTNNISVKYDSDDETSQWDNTAATKIELKNTSSIVQGEGAEVKNNRVTISSPGTYIISGKAADCQIIINTEAKEAVKLVLSGADITCSDSAPVYVLKAKKTVIILADGTQNIITDGNSYKNTDKAAEEPNAAIFAKSHLTINGNGSLTVNANYKNGILSKDELKIMSGNITVKAAADGIRGKDFVAVKNGNISITASEDGIKSNKTGAADKGFVLIENGKLDITSIQDAIQAETSVLVKSGDITVSSGGGNANAVIKTDKQPDMGFGGSFTMEPPPDLEKPSATDAPNSTASAETPSSKGIKAEAAIIIDGGSIIIDSADDSIHSNNSIVINGGSITIAAGDDGIHADTSIEINGGIISITKSYEGIESANITVNDGNIHITAADDGVNVSGGNDNSSQGRPGQNNINSSGNDFLNINGGYLYVDSEGDGLDANGSIRMTNGTVLVNGPTADNNGALDYDGTFEMTGGFLVSAGSSGMAQSPGSSSSQNSVMLSFTEKMTAQTMVHIENDKGEDILTFVPEKAYQTVVLSSPKLLTGSTYNVYYGGSSAGTEKDGLYIDGTYTSGTKHTSFTISDRLTTIGTAGRGPGQEGPMQGGPMQGGRRR